MVDWYVMLAPQARTPRRYVELADHWAAAVGGVVNPDPHVTVAYLLGPAEPDDVVDALRGIAMAATPVEAAGVLSYTEVPHPLFGYAASLRVVKTPALGELHRAVLAAVRPRGLTSLYVWDDVDPHMMVLRHVPRHPREALSRLAALAPRYRFQAERLAVSQPGPDGGFPGCLTRRLYGARHRHAQTG
jgi:2'-5' RNA ligase